MDLALLKDVTTKLRIGSVKATCASNSGHPTSCSSIAEIMALLHFRVMKYSVKEPRAANADRFVLSKGHAAPILYAAWAEAGFFPVEDLLNLRKITSDLEGHPTPRLPFIDVGTGSLGQGLSIACGMAYAGKYVDKADYRTFCLLGDGESAEGAVWEAINFASHYKLDNLVAIIDVNRLGQSAPTSLEHDVDKYKSRLDAFGWNVYVVDGHDLEALDAAFAGAAITKNKPTAIVAKTYKGHTFEGIADLLNWHGKPLGAKADEVLATLNGHIANGMETESALTIPAPVGVVPVVDLSNVSLSSPPNYTKGAKVATRNAYGSALVKLVNTNDRVMALDGDMKNSTFSQDVDKAYPANYVECFICEQNLVGVGIGLACRDRAIAFVSTFACFLTRAFDQIRMGAISQTNLNLVGSHAGVSIGEDGPSQMALEDLAMFRSIPTCTVFYPSDAVSTERATELAAQTKGMCFIRTTRGATPIVYENDEKFEVGKAKIVRHGAEDKVTVVGAGATLEQALLAADVLAAEGITIRVIDPFTIKPLDKDTIVKSALATGGMILTVEDHYSEGGIGDAVLDVVAMERNIVVKKLCVKEVPRSGTPAQLQAKYGIDAAAICAAVRKLTSVE